MKLALRSAFLTAWRGQRDGERYCESFASFLATLPSPASRRSYLYTLELFFDWYALRFGSMPVPALIRRVHAAAFVEWLRKGALREVIEYRITRDGTTEERAIFAHVSAHPGCGVRSLRKHVGKVDHTLLRMVRAQILSRSPSTEQIRAGETSVEYTVGGSVIDQVIPSTAYRYYLRAREKPSRTTLHQRLLALSSFWGYLAANTGENIGEGPLLVHNIWAPHIKAASRGIEGDKLATRILTTPGLEVLGRVVGQTYAVSHAGGDLLELGLAALRGEAPDPEGSEPPPLVDLRDRAILLLLVWTGLRVEELRGVRWSDVEQTTVRVLGKGSKLRVVTIPAPAVSALGEYREALDEYAEVSSAAGRSPHAARLGEDEAPVAAALVHWGVHASGRRRPTAEVQALSARALARMLRRRGEAAGIARGSPEWRALHPHGLRHLAAHWAIERGVPLAVVQQVLGHSSLAITGRYLQEHHPDKLSLG